MLLKTLNLDLELNDFVKGVGWC